MKKRVVHRPRKDNYFDSVCGLDLHHFWWAIKRRDVTCTRCLRKRAK